jgi:hypothetical protein
VSRPIAYRGRPRSRGRLAGPSAPRLRMASLRFHCPYSSGMQAILRLGVRVRRGRINADPHPLHDRQTPTSGALRMPITFHAENASHRCLERPHARRGAIRVSRRFVHPHAATDAYSPASCAISHRVGELTWIGARGEIKMSQSRDSAGHAQAAARELSRGLTATILTAGAASLLAAITILVGAAMNRPGVHRDSGVSRRP